MLNNPGNQNGDAACAIELVENVQTGHDLGYLLRQKAIKHGVSKDTFYPLPLLLSLLTKDTLQEELKQSKYSNNRWSPEQLVDLIRPHSDSEKPDTCTDRGGYLRIFALLLMQGEGPKIVDFICEGETDGIFPVEIPESTGNLRKTVRKIVHEAGREVEVKELEELKATKKWPYHNREYFFTTQWQFKPAFFDFAHEDTYEFDSDKVILPWVSTQREGGVVCETSNREGGYGVVTQVKIDPSSHTFDEVLKEVGLGDPDSKRQVFALKCLHKEVSGHEDGFRNELAQLRRFNGRNHRNIVTLLASFRHSGAYHFIFPWAECTLEDYWTRFPPHGEGKPPPPTHLDPHCAMWVAKQLKGITGAIKTIHDPHPHHLGVEGFGRHSDLKPDNILWFRTNEDPQGILVVTDLGLATFNREVSRSHQPGSSARVPGYRAPECDIRRAKARRVTDVWTLGCIYLEFITWLLGGSDLVQEFAKLRSSIDHLGGAMGKLFFEFEELKAGGGQLPVDKQEHNLEPAQGGRRGIMRVKRTVAQFFARLHNEPNCSDFVHEALDIIERNMVLVAQGGRMESSDLLKGFEKLFERCQESSGFVTVGNPESRGWSNQSRWMLS